MLDSKELIKIQYMRNMHKMRKTIHGTDGYKKHRKTDRISGLFEDVFEYVENMPLVIGADNKGECYATPRNRKVVYVFMKNKEFVVENYIKQALIKEFETKVEVEEIEEAEIVENVDEVIEEEKISNKFIAFSDQQKEDSPKKRGPKGKIKVPEVKVKIKHKDEE